MTHTLKAILLAVLLLLGSSQVGYAQDFERGLEAAQRGDYATALKEWRPLAEQGDADAQYNLGVMYRRGEGVIQDDREAVKWYRLAAEQGLVEAQDNVGYMYGLGAGVIEDKVYAHMWWNIAASNGDEMAKQNKNKIANIMTSSQLEKATELARECVKKEYKGC